MGMDLVFDNEVVKLSGLENAVKVFPKIQKLTQVKKGLVTLLLSCGCILIWKTYKVSQSNSQSSKGLDPYIVLRVLSRQT